MQKFLTLLGREVRSYFYSPIAYIVLVFFLLLTGVDFFFSFPT
jgi:ABC-2 type transport system permease protein